MYNCNDFIEALLVICVLYFGDPKALETGMMAAAEADGAVLSNPALSASIPLLISHLLSPSVTAPTDDEPPAPATLLLVLPVVFRANRGLADRPGKSASL